MDLQNVEATKKVIEKSLALIIFAGLFELLFLWWITLRSICELISAFLELFSLNAKYFMIYAFIYTFAH